MNKLKKIVFAILITVSAFSWADVPQFTFENISPPISPRFPVLPSSYSIRKIMDRGVFAATCYWRYVWAESYKSATDYTIAYIYKESFYHTDQKGYQEVSKIQQINSCTPKGLVALSGGVIRFVDSYGNTTSQFFDEYTKGLIRDANTGEEELSSPLNSQYQFVGPFEINDSHAWVKLCSSYYAWAIDYETMMYSPDGIRYLRVPGNFLYHPGAFELLEDNYLIYRSEGNTVLATPSSFFWTYPSPPSGASYTVTELPDINSKHEVLYPGKGASYGATTLGQIWRCSLTTTTELQAPKAFAPAGYQYAMQNDRGEVIGSFAKTIDGVAQNQWMYYDGRTCYDLNALVESQIPSGWKFDRVLEIDNYGRIYGQMIAAPSQIALVRLTPVAPVKSYPGTHREK